LVDVLVRDYSKEECTESNYRDFVVHPMVVMEMFELDVPSIFMPFFDIKSAEVRVVIL
jgi:hypothetical protein